MSRLVLDNQWDTIDVDGPNKDGEFEIVVHGYEPYATLTLENIKELYEYATRTEPATVRTITPAPVTDDWGDGSEGEFRPALT